MESNHISPQQLPPFHNKQHQYCIILRERAKTGSFFLQTLFEQRLRLLEVLFVSSSSSFAMWCIIQDVGVKGKGLVAAQFIARGTLLVCEGPIFCWPHNATLSTRKALITGLPVSEKAELYALLMPGLPWTADGDGAIISSKLRENMRPFMETEAGIFPTIHYINHSCYPNSQYSVTKHAKGVVYATKDIELGEEITMAYDKPYPERCHRLHIKSLFGFDCMCNHCLSLIKQQVLHRNYYSPETLENVCNDMHVSCVRDHPASYLKEIYHQLEMMRRRKVGDSRIASLLFKAYIIHASHGDVSRGRLFAEDYLNTMVVCFGEDAIGMERWKDIVHKPLKYAYKFELIDGASTWQSEEPPLDCTVDQFEQWLWARKDQA